MNHTPYFATTSFPTPVFNTLEIEPQGLETILFPETKIKLINPTPHPHLWKIESDEYPYPGDHFIDDSFLTKTQKAPPARTIKLPPISILIKMMNSFIGLPYLWGGNWPFGIPFFSKLYLFQELRGIDCSGLLYFVSDGYIPRNTSSLIHFGKGLPIENLSIQEMINLVLPLDIIVWQGHVVIIIDSCTTIESRANKGVIRSCLEKRLEEVIRERPPASRISLSNPDAFTIRRWHPESPSHRLKL